jgi:hypothetical protein
MLQNKPNICEIKISFKYLYHWAKIEQTLKDTRIALRYQVIYATKKRIKNKKSYSGNKKGHYMLFFGI